MLSDIFMNYIISPDYKREKNYKFLFRALTPGYLYSKSLQG